MYRLYRKNDHFKGGAKNVVSKQKCLDYVGK